MASSTPCRFAAAEILGDDARWIELLQTVQNRHDFVHFQFRKIFDKALPNVVDRLHQHSAGADSVDDGIGNQAVEIGHGGEIELPGEIVLERFGGAATGLEIHVLVLRPR